MAFWTDHAIINRHKQTALRRFFIVWAQSLFVRNIFNDIAYAAFENFTQHIQRLCADRLAMLHPMERIGGKPLLEYELVFRDSLPEQSFIEGPIRNHFHHRFYFTLLNLLTIPNILSI